MRNFFFAMVVMLVMKVVMEVMKVSQKNEIKEFHNCSLPGGSDSYLQQRTTQLHLVWLIKPTRRSCCKYIECKHKSNEIIVNVFLLNQLEIRTIVTASSGAKGYFPTIHVKLLRSVILVKAQTLGVGLDKIFLPLPGLS